MAWHQVEVPVAAGQSACAQDAAVGGPVAGEEGASADQGAGLHWDASSRQGGPAVQRKVGERDHGGPGAGPDAWAVVQEGGLEEEDPGGGPLADDEPQLEPPVAV